MSFDKIMHMYQTLDLGNNQVCQECRKQNQEVGFSPPVSIWHIGDKYHDDRHRVLFVGKNARGTLDAKSPLSEVIDARGYALEQFNNGPAIFRYVQAICARLAQGDSEGLRTIAFTNLIKCNNAMGHEGRNSDGSTKDCTTEMMKTNCLTRLQVFWKEVEILKPRHIVIFSHDQYDDYLDSAPAFELQLQAHGRAHRRKNGAKKILWWERLGILKARPVCILRTSHPERQKKESFVDKVAGWIMRSDVGGQK
jgi:hypothetical protein